MKRREEFLLQKRYYTVVEGAAAAKIVPLFFNKDKLGYMLEHPEINRGAISRKDPPIRRESSTTIRRVVQMIGKLRILREPECQIIRTSGCQNL